MKIESTWSDRLDIRSDNFELMIGIKAKMHHFQFFFTLVWFGGWTVAGYFVFGLFFGGFDGGGMSLFLLFWLCGWLAGWVAAAYSLLWQLWGFESVRGTKDHLSISWAASITLRTRNYELKSIRNVRPDVTYPSAVGSRRHPFWPGKKGSVAFDYGSRTVRFGDELDDAEAEAVADAINTHIGRWSPRSNQFQPSDPAHNP